jgi:predicted metal-binding protein
MLSHNAFMTASTLLVCTRCRAAGADPEAPRAGAALLAALRAAAPPDLRCSGVACLSGCKRGCVAAVMAEGKVGYLFGDLPPDAAGAADLIAVARAHAARADGFLPRAARPERLRAGILARLPPLHWIAARPEEVVTWPA